MVLKVRFNKSFVQIAVLLFLGLAFFYALFDWTMLSIIHSRKTVMVPDLKGKTLTDAVTQLSALNLGIKKEGEEFDQNVPAGTIVRQNPLAGMAVRESKIIRVTISQGGKLITVPSVVGQPVRSAEVAIRAAGLSLGEEAMRYSVVGPKDYVVDQDPTGAATVDKEDAMVNLVISQGPPPNGIRLVPSFAGKQVADATVWAQQNSLPLTVRDDPGHASAPGIISRQDPAPDTDCAGVRELIVYASGGAGAAPVTSNMKMFYYEIPQGGDKRAIRLVLRDDTGETEIFNGIKEPGSKLSIPIAPHGTSRVRIFMNNILVEEQEVQ
ncbi:MAG: PASTA domain-containing protein [Endomicrobiales bacterium]|jgi:serine/threonine-protein kinase